MKARVPSVLHRWFESIFENKSLFFCTGCHCLVSATPDQNNFINKRENDAEFSTCGLISSHMCPSYTDCIYTRQLVTERTQFHSWITDRIAFGFQIIVCTFTSCVHMCFSSSGLCIWIQIACYNEKCGWGLSEWAHLTEQFLLLCLLPTCLWAIICSCNNLLVWLTH